MNLILYTNEFTSGFSFLCRLSSWTGRGDGDLVEEDEQGEVGSHSQSSISRSLGLMSCLLTTSLLDTAITVVL